MPVETAAAAQTLVTHWGPAGVVILGLVAGLIAMFKFFQSQLGKIMADEKAERAEMRQLHSAERTEMRNMGAQRHEQLAELTKESTAAMRATEQVLRDLTGELGWMRGNRNNP